MLIVNVKNGNIEKALKVLKKKVRNTKQNQELREREEYVKPSIKKREKKNTAIYKRKKSELDD
jgi:small subunit ribosomal protein S21